MQARTVVAAMDLLPDDELERLAAERGPDSLEASTLAELRRRRARDEQVHAFGVADDFYSVGPMPDADTELRFLLAGEVARRMKAPGQDS